VKKGMVINMSKIFVVTGKSATGKDTIYKRLVEDKELALTTIVSYTTRPIRSNETQGVEYHFVTEEELHNFKDKGTIIEQRSYDTICGLWHYFTVQDGQFSNKDCNYILIGTLEQYEKIRNYFGKDRVLPIYIEVDAELRLIRSIQREKQQESPRYSEVCRRFLADEEDFSEDNIKRLGILKRYDNENLDQCIDHIKQDLMYVLK
jgi:guanylate kinase